MITSVDTNIERFPLMFHSQTTRSSHTWTCCCHTISLFTPTSLPTYHRFFSYLPFIIINFQYLQQYLYVIANRILNKFDHAFVGNQNKLIPNWKFEYTQEFTEKQNNGEMIIPIKSYKDSAIILHILRLFMKKYTIHHHSA